MGNNLICKYCGETVTQPEHYWCNCPYHTSCLIDLLKTAITKQKYIDMQTPLVYGCAETATATRCAEIASGICGAEDTVNAICKEFNLPKAG